jgi:TolB-like protein/class 3 adenylate cyclase
MPEISRRLTTILASDVAGYSRLASVDEEGIVSRLRRLRQELLDPTILANHGRIVNTAGDSILIEFASVVDATRCAINVQRAMAIHNSDYVPEKRIEFRVGIHLGDVMVESNGDLMGDGVNIAARLESIAEPGGICLSEDAYRQVRDKIAAEFIELGDKDMKNISRPVRVFVVEAVGVTRKPTNERVALGPESAPPRLSIVVLPFANLGGDSEQEYFVDGVTESLTTDLSRMSGSFVIGRNTAFTYKGKAVDLKRIGRELNVRYVLKGSVQRGGNRLRINVQLIDAETGNHLWAERFDKPLADLLDMQDEIVSRLANQLGTELIAAEAHRAERAPHPVSIDLYYQGMVHANRGATPEYIAQARDFFDRALALDPDNIEALVGRATVDARGASYFMTDERAERLAAAEAALTKVLSLAPNHAMAHCQLGIIQIFSNRAVRGIAECERALALDRNLAVAHAQIGFAKYVLGCGEETEAHVMEALRLSPRDTSANVWMVWIGNAKVQIGADEEAIGWFSRGIEANRNLPVGHFFLASALALVNRHDDARRSAQAGLALDPSFSVSRYRASTASDNPVYLTRRERICDGMRRAGIPEG